MAEYIEREATIESIMSDPPDAHYPQWYADKIKAIPSADVAPVRNGRWRYYSTTMQECSNCKRHTARHKFKYCPHCGAIMEDKYHPDPYIKRDCQHFLEKTNADRIRSMSDEELENGIRNLSIGYEPWCDNHCKMNGDDDCNRCLRSWLKQPAETSIKDDCLGMDGDGNGY